MPESDRSTEKLNVWVTPSKKQEWRDALTEGETLTSLVTNSVDKELDDEYIHVDTIEAITGGVEGSVDVDMGAVTDRLEELESAVRSVHREIDDVQVQVTSPDAATVEDLAMDVISHIPRYSDLPNNFIMAVDANVPNGAGNEERRATRLRVLPQAIEDSIDSDSEPEIDGSAYRIAVAVEADAIVVRQALIHLERNTTERVDSVIANGTRHWFRGV